MFAVFAYLAVDYSDLFSYTPVFQAVIVFNCDDKSDISLTAGLYDNVCVCVCVCVYIHKHTHTHTHTHTHMVSSICI